jgi:hypothetical protein
MFLGILTLLTALAISAVAIYYSVAGLVTIFSAAAIPIIIMGSVLEIGKLVTAVWLHRYWHQTVWWLKTYLSLAVVVLMLITSMGIFGFLSRAHIEQTANVAEIVQVIDRINSDIERQEFIIERAETTIETIENRTRNQETGIQEQIDREQNRIDSAYLRVQPAIDEQLAVIERSENDLIARTQVFIDQIADIDRDLQALQMALAANDVRRAQGIIGERQDGALGPATSRSIQAYRERQEDRRAELAERIENIRSQPSVLADRAREEITRLRGLAEQEIADSNTLISRLRSQLGVDNSSDIRVAVEEQEQMIARSRQTIDELLERKFQLEIEYRMFETEVGPIKYIAEFIYGSADTDLLEEAVRWVIIIIIFVFDPLAVLLLIASQYTFELRRSEQRKTDLRRANIDSTLDKKLNEFKEPASKSQTAEITSLNLPVAQDIIQPVTKLESEIRQKEIDELENNVDWKEAKHLWKESNPDETLKEWKQRYITGEIDRLPWEDYLKGSSYKQNEEQSENSIWNRIRNKND